MGNSSADDKKGESSSSSDNTSRPTGVLPPLEVRLEESVKALKGGIHQEKLPRFGFQGQIKPPMGNKRLGVLAVLNADSYPTTESEASVNYHTAIPPKVERVSNEKQESMIA